MMLNILSCDTWQMIYLPQKKNGYTNAAHSKKLNYPLLLHSLYFCSLSPVLGKWFTDVCSRLVGCLPIFLSIPFYKQSFEFWCKTNFPLGSCGYHVYTDTFKKNKFYYGHVLIISELKCPDSGIIKGKSHVKNWWVHTSCAVCKFLGAVIFEYNDERE